MKSGRTDAGVSSYELLSLEARSEGTLLDLACGEGYLLFLLENQLSQLNLIGLDMSASELRLAKRAVKAKLLHGNARKIPLSSGSVDQVLSHMALMLMPDVDEVL